MHSLTTGLVTAVSRPVIFATSSSAETLEEAIHEQASDDHAANCGRGTVKGLKKGGDSFLAVRTGPRADHRTIGELHNGDRVWIIDGRDDWYGVIVPGGLVDHAEACRRLGPRRKLPGSGLGWVSGRWIGAIYP